MQWDRNTVFAVSGQSTSAELFEHDLGQVGVSGTTEPRVGQFSKVGVRVQAPASSSARRSVGSAISAKGVGGSQPPPKPPRRRATA